MADPPTKPAFRALLIGIDCYLPNTLEGNKSYTHLAGCVNDVRRVRDALREKLDVKDEHIWTLTASGRGAQPAEPPEQWPTYSNMVRALKRLCDEARPGDIVYIHYSGHGGRARTMFPQIHGPDGLDEALVPTDVGSGVYLRDVELSFLLRAMVKKGLVVTAVLDACHSGGMQRNESLITPPGSTPRGVRWVDLRAPPAASEVAPLADLERELAAARSKERRDREISQSSGWLQETTGYVLVAACRAAELANETFFEGGTSGALTYALCRELRALRPGVTYKVLGDRLVAAVHGRYPKQTPSIEGVIDRVVFGTDSLPLREAINVLSVDAAKSRIRLDADRSSMLAEGARLAVYPGAGRDFDAKDQRLAIVEITEIAAGGSWANVAMRLRDEPIQPGDQAIVVQEAASSLQRRVRLLVPDERRAALRNEIERAGCGLLAEARAGQPGDFQVVIDRDGFDEIQDGAGKAYPFILPKIQATARGANEKLLARLLHLSKYHNVLALSNRDPASRLTNKLKLELIGWQADYDPDKGAAGRKPQPFADPARPVVPHGAWFFLKIKNDLDKNQKDPDDPSRILNVSLLDLGPRWQVQQIWPQNAKMRALQPGAEEILGYRSTVPQGADRCVETLKAIATIATTSFRWMELPKLDETGRSPLETSPPIPRNGNEPSPQGPPGAELNDLHGAVAASLPRTRGGEAEPPVAGDFTTAQVEFATQR